MFDHLAMFGEEIDLPGVPAKQWDVVIYKDKSGYIVSTFQWVEIDDGALRFLGHVGEA